jgi:hypothetical protein
MAQRAAERRLVAGAEDHLAEWLNPSEDGATITAYVGGFPDWAPGVKRPPLKGLG